MLGLFCVLILFIWFAALKPLSINKEINWALYYSKNNQCEKAVQRIDNILSSHSIVDSYVRLKYIDIIKDCLIEDMNRKYVLAPKAVQILRELKELMPNYTRIWIFLGNYLTILIENKEVLKIGDEDVEKLKKEIAFCYQKAYELSPKREEVLLNWIKTDFLFEDYQAAKEKTEQCINLNPNLSYCWWKKAIAHIYLKEFEQADKTIKIAHEKGHSSISKQSLLQLQKTYVAVLKTIEDKDKNKELYIECHKKLADVYEKLIYIDYWNFQYHASLAYIYKEIGEYDKAREQAMIVLQISPESKPNIDAFLNTLPK